MSEGGDERASTLGAWHTHLEDADCIAVVPIEGSGNVAGPELVAVELESANNPRTMAGKRPSAAALQREHEYIDWLLELPEVEGDVPRPVSSWEAFMAAREVARSQQRAKEQREERWRKRGLPPPADHVDAREQVQREWQEQCDENGWPAHAVFHPRMRRLFVEDRHKRRERARLGKITEQRRAAREACTRTQQIGPSKRRGRPIDPSSHRQQLLEERERLENEDPAARAQREHGLDTAACAALLGRRAATWASFRERRGRDLLARVPEERQAEVKLLFEERVRLEDAAWLAAQLRDR